MGAVPGEEHDQRGFAWERFQAIGSGRGSEGEGGHRRSQRQCRRLEGVVEEPEKKCRNRQSNDQRRIASGFI